MDVRTKLGRVFHVQDCCGAWDRNIGFHFAKCKAFVASTVKGKK